MSNLEKFNLNDKNIKNDISITLLDKHLKQKSANNNLKKSVYNDFVKQAKDFASHDIVNPFVNSAFITGYDSVAHLINEASSKALDKKLLNQIKPLKTDNAKPYTASWFVSQLSSGVGSLVPFVVAGKVANLSMGSLAESLDLSPELTRLAANEKLAQIAGAGAYSALLTPEKGQSRLSNSLATIASFSVFEAGNSLKLGDSVLGRAAIGFVGGTSQVEFSKLLTTGHLANMQDVTQQGVSSMALNVLLPFAQEQSNKVHDFLGDKFGNGVRVNRFVAKNGLNDVSPTLDHLVDENRFAKVKINQASINHVDLSKKAITLNSVDPAILGHELAHLSSLRDPYFKANIEQVKNNLLFDNTSMAKQIYVRARLFNEQTANIAENNINLDFNFDRQLKPTNIDEIALSYPTLHRSYFEHYGKEFDAFKAHGNLAQIDFHGDRGDGPGNNSLADKVVTMDYPNGTQSPYGTATKIMYYPDGAKTYSIAQEPSGQIYKYVMEAAPDGVIESPYGDAKLITSFENQIVYDIIKGKSGIENDSKVIIYNKLLSSPYGRANYFENRANGDVVFENSIDGSHGIIYKNPVDFDFLKGVKALRQYSDGSANYWMNQSQMITVPKDITKVPDLSVYSSMVKPKVSLQMTGKPLDNVNSEPVLTSGDKSVDIYKPGSVYEYYPDNYKVKTDIGDVQAILREPNQTTYFLPDGSSFVAKPNGQGLDVYDHSGNLVKSLSHIEEDYPASDNTAHKINNETQYGYVDKVITGPQATNFISSDGTQNIVFRDLQPSDYGNVISVKKFANGDSTYFLSNGDTVSQLANPVNTTYGYVDKYISHANGDLTFLRENGMNLTQRSDGLSVVEDFPNGIYTGINNTKVTQVERYLTALVYHFADGSSASVDYKNGIARIINKDGTFSIQTIMWSPLAEDYPDGRPTMWGNADSMIITGSGQSTLLFGSYSDAYTNQALVNLLGQPLTIDGSVPFRTPTLPNQVEVNNELIHSN